MNYKILFCVFCFYSSFSQSDYNLKENRVNTKIGYINTQDDKCLNEIEKAKLDVENGPLIYFITPFDYDNCINIDAFTILLQNKKIESKISLSTCLRIKGKTNDCYEKYMKSVINERFGKSFIENNFKKADSLFLINKQKKKKPIAK